MRCGIIHLRQTCIYFRQVTILWLIIYPVRTTHIICHGLWRYKLFHYSSYSLIIRYSHSSSYHMIRNVAIFVYISVSYIVWEIFCSQLCYLQCPYCFTFLFFLSIVKPLNSSIICTTKIYLWCPLNVIVHILLNT